MMEKEGVSINILLTSAWKLYVQYRDAETEFKAAWITAAVNESNFYGGGNE